MFLPTASVMTLSFSLITFTTLLFCNGVTLQHSTERQRLARSTKRSCRSGDMAMVRVHPSITREMSGVVSTFRGSWLYLRTSSRVQSRMDVQASCKNNKQHLICLLVSRDQAKSLDFRNAFGCFALEFIHTCQYKQVTFNQVTLTLLCSSM